MSTVNDNKPKNDRSVSPMRDLFIENTEKGDLEQQSQENQAENQLSEEPSENSKNSPSERLKGLKMSLEKLVTALKQPVEDTSYEDDNEDTSSSNMIAEYKKLKEEDNPEFVIQDIFANINDDTENSENEKIKEVKESKEKKVNVIYQAESKPKPVPKEKMPVPLIPKKQTEKSDMPPPTESRSDVEEMTAEKLWKELPAYDLFDESKNDTKAKTTDTQNDIIKAVKKESSKPIPKAAAQSKEKKPLNDPIRVKQNVVSIATPVPTVPPVAEEAEPQEKDLREGDAPPIVYHCDNSQPFIVMAGKFTRTLRGEYTDTRSYRKSQRDTKNNAADHTKKVSDEKEKIVALPKSSPVPKTVKSDKEPVKKAADAPAIIKTVKPTVEPPKKEVPKKPKAVDSKKPPKKKFQFSFRDFMGSVVDEPNEQESEKVKPKKMLDDYDHEKDADDIRTEIEKNLHTMVVRTGILLITDIVAILVAVIAQFTPLFSETLRIGWLFYGIIAFALFTVAVITARLPIVNGLMPLRHFKGNSDTAAAVTALAVGIQSITALCTPHVFTNGTYHIYVPIAITALLCNSIGKLLIILRTRDNFKFLAKPFPKYAGKIYTDMKNAEKMVSEFPSKMNIIGYVKRSKFMSNFLRLSYAQDPSEELASKLAPFTTVIALVFGIAYGIITLDFAGGVTSFALTACVGTPMMSLIVLNIPMKILCKSLLNGNAMISGYGAVQQFCDTNAIMVDTSQLYPTGTVTLSGMKVFKQAKLNDAMQAGAAIMYAVNGTMSYVFENIVHCSQEQLPKVESVVYEDGKGLLAWVNKQRVLVGNRLLLETHNIKVPRKELEEKYFARGNEIMYISISGELIAMFILSYRTDREIAGELRELEENGVSFIVRTIDPNITKEKIAEKFGLFHRCITVLPTGLGNICHEVTSSVDERTRAYLVTKGKISSFARAVSGCIKMKSSVTIAKILQCLGIGFGVVVFTLISFVSGFQKLGSIEILIYIIFWAVATIIASLIKNR